ncbi:MAG: hypothetical protein MJ211_07635 [Bacteroidales bacterium]|nr:hypothetical protein [Bacteroidales bacterium]
MKKVLFILIIFCLVSCKVADLKGLYSTPNCGFYSIDCFKYYFENQYFTYWYSHNVLGEIQLNGKFIQVEDSIFLYPNKYVFQAESGIHYSDSQNDSIHISIALIPDYLGSKPDTIRMPWLIKINNEEYFSETDPLGFFTIDNDSVYSIEIKDYASKYNLDEQYSVDTILNISKSQSDINIYLATGEIAPMVIPPVTKFVMRKNKLIACDSVESVFKPSSNIFYKSE